MRGTRRENRLPAVDLPLLPHAGPGIAVHGGKRAQRGGLAVHGLIQDVLQAGDQLERGGVPVVDASNSRDDIEKWQSAREMNQQCNAHLALGHGRAVGIEHVERVKGVAPLEDDVAGLGLLKLGQLVAVLLGNARGAEEAAVLHAAEGSEREMRGRWTKGRVALSGCPSIQHSLAITWLMSSA